MERRRQQRGLERAVPRGRVAWGLVALLAIPLAGAEACSASSDDAGTCRTGADCPSGVCEAGVCQSADVTGQGGAGGSSSSDGGGDSSQGGDGASSQGGGTSSQGGGGPLCDVEGDGEIRRDEVPLEAGFRANFLTTATADFNSAPDVVDGTKTWDFDVEFSGDHSVTLETRDPSTEWYGAVFPDASYASRLSDTSDLMGVFQATDDALLLLGVASKADGLTRTELTYDPPVVILDFPLTEGKSWSTTTTVSGLAEGIGVFYYESYDDEVDARGVAQTPYDDFDVLRVRVDLTRTFGVVTTQRTFAFVTECFGTVARVVSQENESSPEFADPSEVLRLSP